MHLTGLQPCLILRPPAFAVGALYCIGKLGHYGVLGDVRLLGQPPGVDLLLGGVGALRQHIHSFFDIFQPLGILLEVVFVLEPPQPEVQRVSHTVQQCLEPLGAILFDVLIRIFCTRDLQHAHLDRAVAEQFQRAQGGLLAGLIRVVAQDDFLRVLADELYLIRGQGRAAGADRRVDARLMHGNNVHVTLAENEPPGSALLGDLQSEHGIRLVIDQCLGAVDILGFGIVQHTPAKGNDVAPQVKDGGHHPLPEQAVDSARLAALEQAAGIQLLLVVPLIAQILVQPLPVIRCIAQPEPDDGLVVQTAPPPVGPGLPGFLDRGVQAGVEVPRGFFVHGKDAAAQTARLVVLLRLRHSRAGSQHLDRLGVVDAVDAADEVDDIAAHTAAKTIKALSIRVDVERGGFFAVEGAQAAIQPPLPLELDIVAHHIHDIGAAGQFLNIFVWDHFGIPMLLL